MASSVVSSYPAFFPHLDMFQCTMEFLDAVDVCRSARVCKLWNKWAQTSHIWKNLFEREGIPLVISLNGKERDYREDFKILYPITISGRIISQLFGEVVQKIPPISETYFDLLKYGDIFEEGKSIGENYVFVVEPSFVKRSSSKEFSLTLDESGNLIERPKRENEESSSMEISLGEEKDLRIPFSLKNLETLSTYPLKGRENTPVFHKAFMSSWSCLLTECDTCSDKIKVYFMRKQIVEHTREKSYSYQESFFKKQGFEIAPFRARVIFDCVQILKFGTCPDAQNPTTYARGCETFFNVYRPLIGNFAPGIGVEVMCDVWGENEEDEDLGVAPIIPMNTL